MQRCSMGGQRRVMLEQSDLERIRKCEVAARALHLLIVKDCQASTLTLVCD